MTFHKEPTTPTTFLTVEQLVAMGYRRVSNAYCHVARIDRPDWLNVLANTLHRLPAEFYAPGEPYPRGMWCDHYRRGYSKDVLTVSREMIGKIPSSNFDDISYVPIANEKLHRVSVRRNRWGNYGCFIGREKVCDYGQEFDAMVWLINTLEIKYTYLSSRSDFQQTDIDKFNEKWL